MEKINKLLRTDSLSILDTRISNSVDFLRFLKKMAEKK